MPEYLPILTSSRGPVTIPTIVAHALGKVAQRSSRPLVSCELFPCALPEDASRVGNLGHYEQQEHDKRVDTFSVDKRVAKHPKVKCRWFHLDALLPAAGTGLMEVE